MPWKYQIEHSALYIHRRKYQIDIVFTKAI